MRDRALLFRSTRKARRGATRGGGTATETAINNDGYRSTFGPPTGKFPIMLSVDKCLPRYNCRMKRLRAVAIPFFGLLWSSGLALACECVALPQPKAGSVAFVIFDGVVTNVHYFDQPTNALGALRVVWE